jgi:pyruvate kinase
MIKRPSSKTKVLATLGPACSSPKIIREMMKVGVNAFRLNMSHGDVESRTQMIAAVKKARADLGIAITIMADLRGPRIRLGRLESKISLQRGSKIAIKAATKMGRDGVLPVDYPRLLRDLKVGNRVLIRDGRIALKVLAFEANIVLCRVLTGGEVSSNQGVNLPDSVVSAPALSAKDRADILFAVEHELDWLALSFVRSAADIKAVRRQLEKHHFDMPIVAKIEHPLGIQNLAEIMDTANGIMVARGDLAVEMGHSVVPTLQKRMIRMALEHSLPVIVATQMLESMIDAPQPTRAEVSDVANAVIDGADCVMLSGETAVGQYPVETCRFMKEIAMTTEGLQFQDNWRLRPSIEPHGGQQAGSPEMATVKAAVCAAENSKAKLILAFTESGRSARLVGSFRGQAPIVALTTNDRSYHRMSLMWGVRPGMLTKVDRIREMHRFAARYLEKHHVLRPDQFLVSLTGTFAVSGATNTVRLIRFHQLV